ncbi:cupin domain-containing protein [Asticcacaulis tiandongensis]|uniref:cupin domain-containing protein n=1 Tax=Asticcacaulis tiandongensis TaxID=2565365 RepID=UPI001127AB4C|nr:cupin domain-containing protein [Asticcacaulis tiandongensis]
MSGLRVIKAAEAPLRQRASIYPPEFAVRMAGRAKRPLGDLFGLGNFGVNYTELRPGAVSALAHAHSRQDEFIYVLQGQLVLVTDTVETLICAGDCAGFPAGGDSHHLENRSDEIAIYLEVGDRTAGDVVTYPQDDLKAVNESGVWVFTRKDGTPF